MSARLVSTPLGSAGLILGLSLLGMPVSQGLILEALVPAALAADPLPARGLTALLPSGPVLGDGATETVLHAILLTPTGAPALEAKLKASVEGGTAGDVEDLGNGLYKLTITADPVQAPGTLTVSLKGRVDALGPIEITRQVPVLPPTSGRIQVTTNMPAITLGQDGYATISFSFPATLGPPPTAEDVLVRTSAGKLSAITPMGAGRFTARFEPPAVNYPHLAVITISDRRDPQAVYGSTVVRLMGKVDYPVTAPAGANVVLRVGGREFGPVTVDATGRGLVPIIVPPGISAATQITANGGDVAEEMIDLRVPPTRRIALFEVPPSIPSDSRVQVPIRVAVDKPDGAPDPSAKVTLTATAGRVSQPTHVGDGVYEATFTPPDGRVEVEATLQASVEGGGQGDAVEVRLTPPMPASLALSAEPATLEPKATALEVFASLRATDGAGLPGRDVDLSAIGATPKAALQDVGGGDYRRSFRADGETDVLVRAIARAPVSDNALARVILVPASSQVAPGGTLPLLVVTADTFGYPVPGWEVVLSIPEGGGTVPARVTTDAHGMATLEVTAGAAPGLLVLHAEAGAAQAEAAVVQAAVKTVPPLPASGDAKTRAVHNAWTAAQGTLFIDRAGVDALPMGAGAAPMAAAGPASAISVTATPEGVVAGQDTVLMIEARDADGAPVDGSSIEVFANAGAVPGAVESLGGGRYRATVTAPATLSGPIKVNVVADDGRAVTVVELSPIDASGDSPWGGGVSTQEVASAPAEPAKEDKPPAKEVERPFLRVRASALFSGYSYEQAPSDDPGPLYPSALGWGFQRGGAAVPFGLDASARLLIPKLPYLGIQGGFRWSRYSVESAAFDNAAVDNLLFARAALVGRYPFQIGRDEISIGARVGFRWDDFISFRGSSEPGSQITYEPVALPGLDVGLELGAEVGKFYVLASGTAGFAYGSIPYAANVDLNLGYNITRFFLIDVGFAYTGRKADLEGGDSGVVRGTLRDRQIMGTVGVGFGW